MTGDTPVDPRANPGSYEQTETGFKRLDEPTAPAVLERAHPAMDLETAKAIAEANAASGFPTPPQVQAVIDDAAAADKAAQVADRAAAKAEKAQGKPTPPSAVASPVEPKE